MKKDKPAKPTGKDKHREAEWQKQKDEWSQMQSATKKIFKEYKPKLGKYVAHMVMGPNSKRAEAQLIMTELFGEESVTGHQISVEMEMKETSRLVVLDQTVEPPVIHLGDQGTHAIPGV
jgi:hypothetical protein